MVLFMWKWLGLFLKKDPSFKVEGLSFSSKLDRDSYIVFIATTVSKKILFLILFSFFWVWSLFL